MIKRVLAAFTLILCLSAGAAMAATEAPTPTPAMLTDLGVFTETGFNPRHDTFTLGQGVKWKFLGGDLYGNIGGGGKHRKAGFGFDSRLYLDQLLGATFGCPAFGSALSTYGEIGGFHEGRGTAAGMSRGGFKLAGGGGVSAKIPLPAETRLNVLLSAGYHTEKGVTLGAGVSF